VRESFDGPAILARNAEGSWELISVTIDHYPLGVSHQMAPATRWVNAGPATSVRLASADLATLWHFNLALRNTDEHLRVKRQAVTLACPGGEAAATASSLQAVPLPGRTWGLIAGFEPSGRLHACKLQVVFELAQHRYPVRFDLDAFEVPTPPPSPSP
jgi:hypothetical protein